MQLKQRRLETYPMNWINYDLLILAAESLCTWLRGFQQCAILMIFPADFFAESDRGSKRGLKTRNKLKKQTMSQN